MQRFAPFNFILDVVLSKGAVNILEMGYLENSGLDSFAKINGFDPYAHTHAFSALHMPMGGQAPLTHSSNLRAATISKSIFYALFADACRDVFPGHAIYAVCDAAEMHRHIARDFKGQSVAIKNPTANRGEGVRLLQPEKLGTPEELEALRNNPNFNPVLAQTPTLAIQRFIEPDTIVVDGKSYAPTTRIVMTAYQTPEGRMELAFHGAYHRLPHAPLETGSLSDAFICKGWAPEGREKNAALIENDVWQNIQAQLETFFKPRLAEIYTADPLKLARDMLAHQNRGIRLTGLDFVTSLRPHCWPEEAVKTEVTQSCIQLAETDLVARHYLVSRAGDDPDTWSPIMGGLLKFAQSLETRGGKPVIRVRTPVPQAVAMR